MLIYTNTGLTLSRQTDTASPAAKLGLTHFAVLSSGEKNVDEFWALLSPVFIAKNGLDPAGFNGSA